MAPLAEYEAAFESTPELKLPGIQTTNQNYQFTIGWGGYAPVN